MSRTGERRQSGWPRALGGRGLAIRVVVFSASRSKCRSPMTDTKPGGRTVAHEWFGLEAFDRRAVCSGVYLGVIQ